MGNSLNYIYFFIAILVVLYFFITNRHSRKPLFMLLLSMILFYSSAYSFYYKTYPINLLSTLSILVFWWIILLLLREIYSREENIFWNLCLIYVALYHLLHYVFDSLAQKNVWYGFIFYVYTNVGLLLLGLYYFLRVYKNRTVH
ncbi:Uncharacterised protein [Priestia megaterium]|nr:Uncharacterised protein [Priestia megaterium]